MNIIGLYMESIIESKMKTAANLFPYETHSLVLKENFFLSHSRKKTIFRQLYTKRSMDIEFGSIYKQLLKEVNIIIIIMR